MRYVVLGVLLALAMPVAARQSQEPGYGKPPTYGEAVEIAFTSIGGMMRDPANMYGFAISRPEATCMRRGHPGRSEVCGYRMCVVLNAKNAFGGYVGFRTYTLISTPERGPFFWEGGCTVPQPWLGDPPVEVRSFCADNPKHSACEEGFMESFAAPTLEASTAKPGWMTGVDGGKSGKPAVVASCSDEFKDQLRSKGMSYKDISDVCTD